MILVAGLAVFASLGAIALYLHGDAAPACDSEAALGRVSAILRDQFHLDSLFVNNIGTVTGGYFAKHRECAAEIASIRGDVDASDMHWREIHYRIDQPDKSVAATIAVQLGGPVPLAPPAKSLWERLLARL